MQRSETHAVRGVPHFGCTVNYRVPPPRRLGTVMTKDNAANLPVAQIRVLIVDDDESHAQVMAEGLERIGDYEFTYLTKPLKIHELRAVVEKAGATL